MAELTGLPPSQLTTLLNTLASIEQRLQRIETAVRVQAFNPMSPDPSAAPPATAVTLGNTSTQAMLLNHPANGPTATSPGSGPGPSPGLGLGAFTPLEAPPQGYTISSRDSMQAELDQWTIPRGYSMRIAGAKVQGKKKVRWVCYRGGETRHHRGPVDESLILQAKAEGRRKPTTERASKKCGCMFKFELVETTKGSDLWVLHYPNAANKVHNHGPSDETSDPRARKLPAYMAAEVDNWLRDGRQVSKIQEDLKARGFTNVLNTDLYNRKRVLNKTNT